MKRHNEILLAILLGVILPSLLLKTVSFRRASTGYAPTVTVLTEDGIVKLKIEEYIIGVLLKEMPGDFCAEALKAQAVASRTYTLYRMQHSTKHANADVCTSADCCQGYLSQERYLADGGSALTLLKMYEAVHATRGQVLLYNGTLIEATYFSSSGGKTEAALAVWGTDVPYLQSTDSVEKDTKAKKELSHADFCSALGLPKGEVCIGTIYYTDGEGIAEAVINGVTFTGRSLRSLLGLHSTRISFVVTDETVQVITNGNGHRVGMSQYGAESMAKAGSDYMQILTHYYNGVVIQNFTLGEN